MTTHITEAAFAQLPATRLMNTYGPCLTGYRLVRQNARTATVAYRNGREISVKRVTYRAHAEPCALCPGGHTYPNGYEN